MTLPGHLHPDAVAANDQGRAETSLTLEHISVFLKPSAAQQADLTSFLAQQQDPGSPNYHHWLTPEQYADRFGVSKTDAGRVARWLQGENMQSVTVARGRNSVSFTGNVRDVERAFGLEIHWFQVRGEMHFANASEPSLPADIGGLVAAIHGLHDFRMKPLAKVNDASLKPAYTSGVTGHIFIAPDDIATIYDVKPLLNSGISGSAQKVAVAGQTNINIADIEAYRAFYNLPALDPQLVLVPGMTDPGISSGDLIEADLDIEIAGAIARNATVIFVYSNDVEASAFYAIDQNLAPVLSMSYGLCEPQTATSDLMLMQKMAQQANAQGITWIAASGDNGGADCYTGSGRGNANSIAAVDAPASIPEVTGVGGTEFVESSGTYWAASNNANHASALSYIPEMVWNDSVADNQPAAGGGGASSIFAKPAWQTGTGVPGDGRRDVPDISLASSADHDGFYIYSGGALKVVGGTSCAAPAFAGMVTLLNQYLVANGLQKTAGLGNVNSRLYALATSAGVFHDITAGSNIVDGCIGVRTCTVGPVGFSAGPGYDQASGLGSVDLFNLAAAWAPAATTPKNPVSLSLKSSAATLLSTASVTLTATVMAANGGTPSGTITFYAAGHPIGSAAMLSGGVAVLTNLQGSALPVGLVSVSAEYSGDASYAGAGASLDLTVTSTVTMAIQGIANAASGNQAFSPGAIISIYGSQLAGATLSAASVPLPTMLGGVSVTIGGTPAPLYFVSPSQLNVQIPYSAPTAQGAVGSIVSVTWNGKTVTTDIPITGSSPGIFIDYATGAPAGAPTAKRGQTIAIYVTGAGAVSPPVATGSTPSGTAVPIPTLPVSITVGGVSVSTAYAYIGVPAWAIGLIQINFTVPATAPLGSQPVIVNINGTISSPANIVLTQ